MQPTELDQALAECARRWNVPTLRVELLPRRSGLPLHAAEWCVAQAAARGDAGACEVANALCVEALQPWLSRNRFPEALQEEALQTLRVRLFGSPAAAGNLAEYEGQGPLRLWLRVVGVRTALNVLRASNAEACGEVALDDRSWDRLPLLKPAPEKALLNEEELRLFKRAFEQAVSRMEHRMRVVLGLRFVRDTPIEDIARLYSVHRVTVSKWLREARAQLEREVTSQVRALAREEGVSFDPSRGWVLSQLELSLTRLLSLPQA
ncbi:MAG: hypothetical protein ACT4TC_20630 [Myxococcaceae bacterium]